MLYVISDTHFFHFNIIRYCGRPFSGTDEMNQEMISRWNAVVNKDDNVWHLGDFCLGKQQNIPEIKNQLNGNITLIKGNHDRGVPKMNSFGFETYLEPQIVAHNGFSFCLSHYPMFSKRLANIHLFGHVHDKTPDNTPSWAFNVSVEMSNYTPRPIEYYTI